MTDIEAIREDAPMIEHQQNRGEMIRYTSSETLAITREPEDVLADAQKAAAALMKVVGSKKKQIVFNGETYLESGDWQTVGKFYGVTAKVESTRFVQFGDAQGFEAAAVAIDCNGREVSRGESMCLNDEENWGMRARYEWQDVLDANGKKIWEFNAAKGKDLPKREKVKIGETSTPLFQLRSMAQTRACAKALSNLFKWVVVLAGYKPTPAEEMIGTEEAPEPTITQTEHRRVTPASVEPPTPKMKAEGYPANLSQEQSPISDNPDSEPDIVPKSRKASPTPQAAPQAPQPQQQAIQGEVATEPRISPAQGKRFFAIARSAGVSDDEVTARLAKLGYTGHRDEMPKRIYNAAVDAVDPTFKFHTNEPRG